MQEPSSIPKNKRPPQQPKVKDVVLGKVASFLIKGLSSTIRFSFNDPASAKDLSPAIFCIWHNRLALCLNVFTRYLSKGYPDRRLAALASASNDGAFLSVILQSYGVHAVRGSSSRRGSQAMKELITLLRKGYDLSLTPDGPRGPKYKMQSGVISLAQLTGKPVIPVSYVLSMKWTLNTWDAFQIPMPFAKCVVHMGEPVYVDRNITADQRDALANQLSEEMIRLGGEQEEVAG
ncbi:MAG: lysophospholipid acyltransferase family protein [Verrucomicrobia bacterium]|jgi:lysophospholipid acyltransferase (LPLAT)-like uncharacterized protein|nr:lysophospholipid acyltransferase family protein [Verrucomicrobiota bacterium]MDB4484863.1 lysophospholipid acyltransferase family protein [bacterium]MBT5060932.1 lysophospholipid acyltransferase family protein [Verrucomicrobiota bacterium]MBT6239668.1 lysophospholipid acyltransferase family protein [Verrucomicrobiota bacterium]MBT6806629.1 lysophospholipid acyltransferase family protein [Verrucomicrobiota bacterium]